MNYIKSLHFKKHHITSLDISIFLRQFFTLLTAGISLLHCFEILEKNQTKPAMRHLIHSIKQELLSGKNLYASLSSHPRYFNDLACQLVNIGEHTGKLDTSLQLIADEYEKQIAFIKHIKNILFYPCVLTLTAIIITISLFLFVIPRFAEIFSGTPIQLPFLTRALFFLSAKLNQHLMLLLLLPTLCMLAFFPRLSSIKPVLLKLPLLHHFMKKIMLIRFTRHLAMTFAAGIPITDALKLSLSSHRHPEFTPILIILLSHIHSGLPLHQAMQTLSYFPDLLIQMVKIGEESGSLDNLLFKTATLMEADVDHLLNQFSRLLEPLIMLVLGVLIGGLIIGMYLPIFKLGSVL